MRLSALVSGGRAGCRGPRPPSTRSRAPRPAVSVRLPFSLRSGILPTNGPLPSLTSRPSPISYGEYRWASINDFRLPLKSTSTSSSPASIRATSSASMPVGRMSKAVPRAISASQTRSAPSCSTHISYPRSPVYPVREICTGTPSIAPRVMRKYLRPSMSASATERSSPPEVGPCSANAASDSLISSMVTFRPARILSQPSETRIRRRPPPGGSRRVW